MVRPCWCCMNEPPGSQPSCASLPRLPGLWQIGFQASLPSCQAICARASLSTMGPSLPCIMSSNPCWHVAPTSVILMRHGKKVVWKTPSQGSGDHCRESQTWQPSRHNSCSSSQTGTTMRQENASTTKPQTRSSIRCSTVLHFKRDSTFQPSLE